MMQYSESLAPIAGVIIGALVTSTSLGLVLRHQRNIFIEYPISIRFVFLIVLATVFGLITLVYGLVILLFAGPVSLCFGIVLLREPRE